MIYRSCEYVSVDSAAVRVPREANCSLNVSFFFDLTSNVAAKHLRNYLNRIGRFLFASLGRRNLAISSRFPHSVPYLCLTKQQFRSTHTFYCLQLKQSEIERAPHRSQRQNWVKKWNENAFERQQVNENVIFYRYQSSTDLHLGERAEKRNCHCAAVRQ